MLNAGQPYNLQTSGKRSNNFKGKKIYKTNTKDRFTEKDPTRKASPLIRRIGYL